MAWEYNRNQVRMVAILAQKRITMPGQFHHQFAQFVESYYEKHPVKAEPALDLSKTQQALELQFPEQLSEFYTSYFGGGLKVQHERGELELLMSWHQADFERLQQNIIAHILMKRRLKQRETVFIAATDHDDYLVSVLVATGEVYLEKVGMEVKELLAPDLATFLQQLSF
jgi:SecY interacting protein Syd